MDKDVVVARGIKKSLGGSEIIKNLNLSVPEGAVFALVGNNGHGKSTTVRLLAGLLEADQGELHVLGCPMPRERIRTLARMGCLVDSPAAYANLSASEFMRVIAKLKRRDCAELRELLDLVGLADTGKKKVGRFSLGMKQRLALAAALIGKPELVLLDEPTNALDPSGIREIRELLRRLPRELGCTVIFTTHQLEEVEKVASHVARIHEGTVLSQTCVQEIGRPGSGWLELVSLEPEKLASVGISLGLTLEVGPSGVVRIVCESDAAAAALISTLVLAGVPLIRCAHTKPSVEEWFMSMDRDTGGHA